MTDVSVHPVPAGLYSAWEAGLRETERAALAVLRTALPGAATGTTPDVLLAPAPGGGRITVRLEDGTAATITADRLRTAAAQVLLDNAAQPGWFSALTTTDGHSTESLANADPDEYGEPSNDRIREDTLRVRSDGTASLVLHGVGLRRAANGLYAAHTALTAVRRPPSVPSPVGSI